MQSEFRTHFDAVRARVKKGQDFIAGTTQRSYDELFARTDATTRLFADIGLAVGDRAVIACADEFDVAGLYIACLITGVSAVMIDPNASPAEASLLATTADPKAVFIDQALFDQCSTLGNDTQARLIPLRARAAKRTSFGLLRRSDNDGDGAGGGDSYPAMLERFAGEAVSLGEVPEDTTGLILFTSGTTSRPKGVELTHKNLLTQFGTFCRHYGFDENTRIINHMPLHHTDGLNQGPAIALYCGGTWIRPVAPTLQTLPEVLDAVYRERATHLITVPTVLALMLRLPSDYDDAFDTGEFVFVGSTAGHLDENLWREFEARFRTMVVNSYGLTETVSESLYCGPNQESRRIGTIGRPVDCEACILGDDGQPARVGETGELALRGDTVMKGYFRNPEASGAVMKNGWFLTGDLASVDNDGIYRIVGRKKNVVIRGGVNVYPEDVTNSVLEVPGVLDAVTFGLEDELLGERVVTCATLDGSAEVKPNTIIDHCRAHLPPERVPNDVILLDDLPRGPSGKVVLQEVKTIARQHGGVDLGAAAGSVDDTVFSIAASVFKVPVESLNPQSDDRNTTGWDSLSHLEFIMSLERHFGCKLKPREVMRIAKLDDAVDVIRDYA